MFNKKSLNKILYIIPGWGDTSSDKQYLKLADAVRKIGYEVKIHNVNWSNTLSSQVFAVPRDAVVFGFSLGAILAWLVAQKYPCRLLILASMTPHHSFTDPKIKKSLVELAGPEFVDDIVKNLLLNNKAEKQITMYGFLEDEPGDVLVSNTNHEITDNYIEEVVKFL